MSFEREDRAYFGRSVEAIVNTDLRLVVQSYGFESPWNDDFVKLTDKLVSATALLLIRYS